MIDSRHELEQAQAEQLSQEKSLVCMTQYGLWPTGIRNYAGHGANSNLDLLPALVINTVAIKCTWNLWKVCIREIFKNTLSQ